MTERRQRVLCVGIAALDIINEVAAYPAEDAELRSLNRRILRGGNAANSLSVLAQLGYRCAWAGTIGADAEGELVIKDLESRGIDAGAGVRHPGRSTPTSYVILSRASGSRTIVHHRDLPELSAADFAKIPLQNYAWVHFEGREPKETVHMLRDCRRRLPSAGISVEIEKPRPGIESLLMGPDVLIFSRHYARSLGPAGPQCFLAEHWARTDARLLVLPWGEEGAYAQARDCDICFAAPHKPREIKDTLGAGDVFNAAVIDSLLAGLAPPALLARCNALAGHKCGMIGLDDLVASARDARVL